MPFFRAVRNENSEQGKKLRKEVTLEDVRCKDHQCSEAARRLSSPKVQEIMKSVERVIIPLSPEKYMYSEDNLEPVEGTIKAPNPVECLICKLHFILLIKMSHLFYINRIMCYQC